MKQDFQRAALLQLHVPLKCPSHSSGIIAPPCSSILFHHLLDDARCARTIQAIQFPLAELWTECELVRGLVRRTAAELDRHHHMEVTHLVAMANYRANRLACEAADRAMQTCGGLGYTRHMPFEHIYRHHRRYRITEGSEEIQMRRIAQIMFGYGRPRE